MQQSRVIAMNYASTMPAQKEITYHWCSCGGKSGSGDCSTIAPAEDVNHPGISFTADSSGNVRICQCGTTLANPRAGRAGSEIDAHKTTRILNEASGATA